MKTPKHQMFRHRSLNDGGQSLAGDDGVIIRPELEPPARHGALSRHSGWFKDGSAAQLIWQGF
jgi:hypothetical protein